MRVTSSLLIASLAVIFIVVSGCVQEEQIDTNGLTKACSSDVYGRSFFECEQNNLSAKWAAINADLDMTVDVPTTYYDSQGNEIQTCGLVASPSANCSDLQKLKCKQAVSCAINCDLLEGDNRDQCLFMQAEKTGDKSYCDKIAETSSIKVGCYNVVAV